MVRDIVVLLKPSLASTQTDDMCFTKTIRSAMKVDITSLAVCLFPMKPDLTPSATWDSWRHVSDDRKTRIENGTRASAGEEDTSFTQCTMIARKH